VGGISGDGGKAAAYPDRFKGKRAADSGTYAGFNKFRVTVYEADAVFFQLALKSFGDILNGNFCYIRLFCIGGNHINHELTLLYGM
jgi:hypothetical protein